MSFSGTGIGSGRRLDHSTFINGRTAPSEKSPTRQSYQSVTAYSYAAPDLPTTQRNPSPTRPSTSTRPGHPTFFTSPQKPKEYSSKDTTVNIATAFHQAVLSEMPISTTSMTSQRRGLQTNGPSKSSYTAHVSDSEPEDNVQQELDSKGRPLSKAASVAGTVRSALGRALSPAAFYVRERSKEPEERNTLAAPQRSVSRESSYDYSAEQIHYEELLAKARGRHGSREPTPDHTLENPSSKAAALKRHKPRMSRDDQAYKPGKEDDESEDYDSDSGKKRRRKKKKDEGVGRLTNLPTVDYSKKRKGRKSRGGPDTIDEEPELEDESASFNDTSGMADDSAEHNPFRHASLPPAEISMPSMDEMPSVISDKTRSEIDMPTQATRRRSRSRSLPRDAPPQSRPFISPGAILGTLVRVFTVAIGSTLALILRTFIFLIRTPVGLAIVCTALLTVLYQLGFHPTIPDMSTISFPTIRLGSPYRPPDIPASTVEEFIQRLTMAEAALGEMTRKHDVLQTLFEKERKIASTSTQRVSLLESKLEAEVRRNSELLDGLRTTTSAHMVSVNDEISRLKDGTPKTPDNSKLEESVATVRGKVETVENTLKDVLDHVRTNSKVAGAAVSSGWWSSLAGKSGISIKSSDGKDVSGLISDLVQSAVIKYSKDTVAKTDFALYSSGGRVIPSLTSSSYQHVPSSYFTYVLGWPFGIGRMKGRPPVNAIHHDTMPGVCWPFKGSEGQLGLVLARQVYISEITIDHVAPELALDLQSAPKTVEVWALVEGQDNLVKYRAHQEAKKLQRAKDLQFSKEHGTEPPPPEPVWKNAPSGVYMQLGNFTYDIHAPHHIQTFTVSPDIQALGIDHGIVVFRFLQNWGGKVTCIYRVRVHGVDAHARAPLLPPEDEGSS